LEQLLFPPPLMLLPLPLSPLLLLPQHSPLLKVCCHFYHSLFTL
jgi:hypothetical protein